MRVRGWYGVAVVASVAWALGAYYGVSDYEFRVGGMAYDARYRLCMRDFPSPTESKVDPQIYCHEDAFRKAAAPYWDHAKEHGVVAAVMPILFAWLAGYLILAIGRWMWRS